MSDDKVNYWTKHPIGIKPRWLVTEMRLQEIDEAIERYRLAGKTPLSEWLTEHNDLCTWLRDYRDNK